MKVSPPTRLVITRAAASKAADPSSHNRVPFEIEEYGDIVRLTISYDELEAGSGMAKVISKGWPIVLSSLNPSSRPIARSTSSPSQRRPDPGTPSEEERA